MLLLDETPMDLSMPKSKWLLIITGLLLMSGVLLAETVFVPEDFNTLREALTWTDWRDTVFVRRSIYLERVPLKANQATVIYEGISGDFAPGSYSNQGETGLPGFHRVNRQICGDANGDEIVSQSDMDYLRNYLYSSGPEPISPWDPDADGDWDHDDLAYLLDYLYYWGSSPCPEGWVGQRRVTSKSSVNGSGQRLGIDNYNTPWSIWVGDTIYGLDCRRVWYSMWEDLGWSSQTLVSHSDTTYNYMPTITFDEKNVPWSAWHRVAPGAYQRNVLFSRWEKGEWTLEEQVHPPDTFFDCWGTIVSGGGKTWLFWRSGVLSLDEFVVMSCWQDSGWESPIMVNEPNPGNDTCPLHLAVDSLGNPHFCWTRQDTDGMIYPIYRMYNLADSSFTPEMRMNEPDGGTAGQDLEISIDTLGNLHFAWIGTWEPIPTTHTLAFYRKFEGGTWSEAQCVSVYDSLLNARTAIEAKDPNDVWVVWDGTDEMGEYHINVAHYVGIHWSEEMRLNDNSTEYNQSPDVDMNSEGNPWAVWSRRLHSDGTRQVWYNVYLLPSGSTFGKKVKQSRSHKQ
jgi:hypothetical protein